MESPGANKRWGHPKTVAETSNSMIRTLDRLRFLETEVHSFQVENSRLRAGGGPLSLEIKF